MNERVSDPSPDCLLALDTLGVHCTAAILTIAMLRFNIDDPTSPVTELVLHVDPDSNAESSRTFEAGAFQWWSERTDMREVFARRDTISLYDALKMVDRFYMGANRMWVMNAAFEAPIMTSAYRHFGAAPPWMYWEVTCGRTLCDVAAWLAQAQSNPTAHGSDLLATTYLHLDALRTSYQALLSRVDRRTENLEPSDERRG